MKQTSPSFDNCTLFFPAIDYSDIPAKLSLNPFHSLGRKSLKLLKTQCRQFFQSLTFDILQVQVTNVQNKQTNWFPTWNHDKCSKIRKTKLITLGQIFFFFSDLTSSTVILLMKGKAQLWRMFLIADKLKREKKPDDKERVKKKSVTI